MVCIAVKASAVPFVLRLQLLTPESKSSNQTKGASGHSQDRLEMMLSERLEIILLVLTSRYQAQTAIKLSGIDSNS